MQHNAHLMGDNVQAVSCDRYCSHGTFNCIYDLVLIALSTECRNCCPGDLPVVSPTRHAAAVTRAPATRSTQTLFQTVEECCTGTVYVQVRCVINSSTQTTQTYLL